MPEISEETIDDQWADKSAINQAPVTAEPVKEDDMSSLSDDDMLDFVLAKDDDELLPWESVVLPSKGLYYGDSVPGGVVEVRPMNIYVEKIMSTQRYVKSGQSMDMIFKHCIRFPDPEFDPLDLVSGDGTFLLYYLRGITFGNEYEFVVTCSDDECGYQMQKVFDLNELATTIQWPKPECGEEPFNCELPYMSKVAQRPFMVGIRLIRRRDLLTMTGNQNKHKKLMKPAHVRKKRKINNVQDVQSVNDFIERNLNQIVVSAMGNTNKAKIQHLISRLHSTDSATIREYLENVSPGIDTVIEVECSECGNKMNIGLPITESFFRPTKRGESGG